MDLVLQLRFALTSVDETVKRPNKVYNRVEFSEIYWIQNLGYFEFRGGCR